MGNQKNADPLYLLSLFASGVLTVGVNGLPFLKVDAESRAVDVEAVGVKEYGIRLSKVIQLESGQKGVRGLLKGSESTAKGLSERGWRLTLYDKGGSILTMGRGVSRLTGYVRVNPMKIQKILETL